MKSPPVIPERAAKIVVIARFHGPGRNGATCLGRFRRAREGFGIDAGNRHHPTGALTQTIWADHALAGLLTAAGAGLGKRGRGKPQRQQ